MKSEKDKNKITKSFFTKKSFKWLLFLLLSFFLFMSIKNAYAPPPPPGIPIYTWSAHGNTSYGVNRSSIAAFGYSQANCANCHEQHASIGGAEPVPVTGTERYMLFRNLFGGNQNAGFCFWCHTDPVSDTNQQQISMPYQYNYSRIAGGDTNITCPDDILETCMHLRTDCSGSRNNWCGSSDGSAHCLEDIRQHLIGIGAWNFGAQRRVNPCSGCHNPHRAQRDPHDSTRWTGLKLPGVVSRPSQHSKDNNAWQLWGDDPTERMSTYTTLYQAPCQYPWSNPCTAFEPDGSTTTNGLNLLDTVTFCLDCHSASSPIQPIASTALGRNLTAINWSASGDEHGQNWDSGSMGGSSSRAVPYNYNDFVLSCLDCHEPHGSRNEFLLRQTVNGSQLPAAFSGGQAYYFCRACHTTFHGSGMGPGMNCYGGSCHMHGQQF